MYVPSTVKFFERLDRQVCPEQELLDLKKKSSVEQNELMGNGFAVDEDCR